MAISIAQKLKLKAGFVIRAIGEPDSFLSALQPLPPDVTMIKNGPADQIHWFVKNQQQLEAGLNEIVLEITGTTTCWVYYPKGSSKLQTDLTRDKGWDKLLAHTEFQWISLISFDDTWSAFGFRLKTRADILKEANPQIREIFAYVNPATKEVKLPEDLKAALQGRPENEIFEKLAFSHKKEYIEWVISAKREETRKQRIKAMLEKLITGWKNPQNR